LIVVNEPVDNFWKVFRDDRPPVGSGHESKSPVIWLDVRQIIDVWCQVDIAALACGFVSQQVKQLEVVKV